MDAPLQQGRRGDHGRDDVLGRRGDSHAEDEAGQRRVQEREEEGDVADGAHAHQQGVDEVGEVGGQRNDGRGELQADAGQRRRPDDEPHAGAGRPDGNGVFRPVLEAREDLGDAHLALLVEEPGDDDEHVGPEGGQGRFHPEIEQPREDDGDPEGNSRRDAVGAPPEIVERDGRKDDPASQDPRGIEGVDAEQAGRHAEKQRHQQGLGPLVNLTGGRRIDNAPEGGQEGALPRDEQVDDDEEGEDQKPPLPEHVHHAGEVVP